MAFACIVGASPLAAPAQPPRAIANLAASFDTAVVERYLANVVSGIGRLAPQYPQLGDWGRAKGPAWESAGLRRTRTELEYAHSVTATRSARLDDRFGPNGLRIHVYAYSARDFARVSGMAVGTYAFGAPLGGGCLIATVYTANPRAPGLEAAIADVVKQGLTGAVSCLGPIEDDDYIRVAKNTPAHDIDSLVGNVPFGQWVLAAAGDSTRVSWATDDCGEGGDGRQAPVCVTATVALRGGGTALVSLIVGDLRGALGSPALWSAYVRESPPADYAEVKPLSAWAAAVRARR
jgi:hypothetical protein